MIRALKVAALLFFMFSGTVFAGKELALSRNEEPIKIVSDQLQADNAKKMATFSGNVIARQGDLVIYGDKLVVSFSSESGDINSAEIFGNVRIIQGERRAQSDHAIYDNRNSRIVLDGNPKVFQNNDMITGKTITYYLDEDKSEVSSGAGGRVEAVIHPRGKRADGKFSKP